MGYTAEERETIIRTDDLMDHWIIDTYQRQICTKIRKIKGIEIVKEVSTDNGTVIEGVYKLPLNQLSFRSLRVLTDEKRSELSERAKLMRRKQE